MKRAPLLTLLFASVLFGGACWAQARASANDAAPRLVPDAGTHATPAPSPARKLDEYGDISWSEERERLDNLAIELQNDPTAQGYIICYGGRRSIVGEAERRCRNAMNYVYRARRIDASRIVTVDGGYREELMRELWMAPAGAAPPQASPTVFPRKAKLVKRRYKTRLRGR